MWRWEGEDVRMWEGEGYIREYQMISYLTIMAVPPLPPLPSPPLTIMAAFLLVVVTKPMASSWSGENLESPEANCRRCRMSMYMDVLCVCSTSTRASLEGVRVWGCGCEDVGVRMWGYRWHIRTLQWTLYATLPHIERKGLVKKWITMEDASINMFLWQ